MADTKVSALTELTVPPDPTDELVLVDKSDTTMAASGTDKRIQFSNFFDWAEAGDLSTIEPDDAAAAGTSVEIARADHQHAIAAAATGTIEPDDAAAEGSATSFARSDHKHAIAAAAPASTTTWVAAAGEGTSTSFSRADHTHGLPWAASANAFGQLVTAVQYCTAPASTQIPAVNTYYAVPVLVLALTTVTGIEIRNGGTTNGQLRCALYNNVGTRVADRTSDLAQAGSINTNRRVPFDATYDAVPGFYYSLIWFSSATATANMAVVHGVRATTGTNATTTPTGPGTVAANITAPVMSIY